MDENKGPGTNSGHGHVWKRPDGTVYRCGGPRMCDLCRLDEVTYGPAMSAKAELSGKHSEGIPFAEMVKQLKEQINYTPVAKDVSEFRDNA